MVVFRRHMAAGGMTTERYMMKRLLRLLLLLLLLLSCSFSYHRHLPRGDLHTSSLYINIIPV